MTKRVKTLRSEDPRTQQQMMYDYRFRTLFQIDFYTTVILTRNPVVIKSQWAKWKELKAHKKPSLDRAVDIVHGLVLVRSCLSSMIGTQR